MSVDRRPRHQFLRDLSRAASCPSTYMASFLFEKLNLLEWWPQGVTAYVFCFPVVR